MRVVHLDSGRAWRGGQTQLLLLARHLRGVVEQRVALPRGAPLAAALEEIGIPVVPLDRPWLVRRALQQADLAAAHTSRAHTIALLASPAPVVVHRRVDFVPRFPWKYRAVQGFVAVSRAVSGVLCEAGVAPERIRIVLDGVDVVRWTQRPDFVPQIPRPWVVACGALVDHKGHRHLIEAMRELPGVTVVFLGAGPLLPDLQALAIARGVADRVRWMGAIPEPLPWMAAADVFVHPSVEEGLGQVLMEALLTGAPVVASEVGGIPEVVRGLGTLVPPRDPRALAGAIRSVIEGPSARASAEHRATLGARFGAERMAQQTREAWTALLATPASGPRNAWFHSRR